MNYDIILDTNFTIYERVLYYYLIKKREMVELSVECGYKKKDEVSENGLFYTVHSNQELMELLNCGKTKLIEIKKSLEKKGLLKQVRQMDKSNKYFIFYKEEVK